MTGWVAKEQQMSIVADEYYGSESQNEEWKQYRMSTGRVAAALPSGGPMASRGSMAALLPWLMKPLP